MTLAHSLLAIAERESRASEVAAIALLHTALCETFDLPNNQEAAHVQQEGRWNLRPDGRHHPDPQPGLLRGDHLPRGLAAAGAERHRLTDLPNPPRTSSRCVCEAPGDDLPGLCVSVAAASPPPAVAAADRDLREVRR